MTSAGFSFKLGKMACLVITDGQILVPDPPVPGSSGRANTPSGQIMDVLCLFINTGKNKILIDSGCGDNFQRSTGKLLQNLKANGILPGEIDTIIYTHGHSDHVAGSFDTTGRPVFSNARYVIARKEWEGWVTHPERKELEPMFSAARQHLIPRREKCDLIEDDEEVLPGIRLIAAPGHTPGNIMVELTSGSQQMLCLGDLIHSPLEFSQPDYYGFLDVYPEQAIQTRTRILSQMADSGTQVFACHFRFPGLGRIIRKGNVPGWQSLYDS